MIPFQLSPVDTWKSVRKAIPKFSKVAWRLMPSQGFSSLHTERKGITAISGGHTARPEINSRNWGRGLQASHSLENTGNGLSTLPNSWLLPSNTEKSLMAQPHDIRQCNPVAQGDPPNMSLCCLLLDQYSMARDINKPSLSFSCKLEGNIKVGSAEEAKV